MDGCDCCTGLDVQYAIRTPGEFKKTIRTVHQYLRERRLEEIENSQNREVLGIKPFVTVSSNGPWNDFISHYFQCTHCRLHFLLHVETYNGSGGKWEPFTMV